MNARSATSPLLARESRNDGSFPMRPQRSAQARAMGGNVFIALAWVLGIALAFVGWARLDEALDDPLIAVVLLALPALVLAPLLGGRPR